MSDTAEQKAARLLPCLKCDNNDSSERSTHSVGCGYRPAVAAALKAEIEQIKTVEFPRKVEAVSRDNFVRGLERARQIADEIELMTVDCGIEGAIAAEIDKVKR